MKRKNRYLAQIPIWFSTGISITMLVPLYLGVTLILEPVYDFSQIAKDIVRYKPNFLVSAMGLFEYMKKTIQDQMPIELFCMQLWEENILRREWNGNITSGLEKMVV